jgi:glycosyltransferase involved in cell wall biosynthesis
MPAYNAALTLERTWREVVAHPEVDLVIVVDDASQDETLAKARQLETSSRTRIP